MSSKKEQNTTAPRTCPYAATVLTILLSYFGVHACFGQAPTATAPKLGYLSFEIKEIVPKPREQGEIEFKLELYGLKAGKDLKVHFGDGSPAFTLPADELPQVSPGQPGEINVRLTLDRSHYGVRDLHVEQGDHLHVLKEAIFIAEKPVIEGVPCDEREEPLELAPGKEVSFTTHHPSDVRIQISGFPDPLRVENGRITIPDLGPGEHGLTVTADVASFENRPLCTETLRIISCGSKWKDYFLSYDPTSQTTEMRVEGSCLPDSFDAIVQQEGGANFTLRFSGATNVKNGRVYRSGAAPQELKKFSIIKDAQDKYFRAPGRWVVESANHWEWQWLASPTAARLYDLYKEEVYGKIKLQIAGEEYVFARIPDAEYSIGLTQEKSKDPALVPNRLGKVSSYFSGTVKVPLVSPFLLGVYEVTNRQFMSWIREANLPEASTPKKLRANGNRRELSPGIADLPVTDVSYYEARDFAAWLQTKLEGDAPRWRIRLPHEVEWEMAVRKGEQDYVFDDGNVVQGLSSLTRKEILPVGSNSLDISHAGVRDMAGNVREWTESVFNERMYGPLELTMSNGQISGWDPQVPYAIPSLLEEPPQDPGKDSKNMAVRGGANGEEEQYFLVSVRRQLEMMSKSDEVGFRLVLVFQEGS